MASVGITENVKGDSRKFEIWYNAREEVYIIQVGQGRGREGLDITWVGQGEGPPGRQVHTKGSGGTTADMAPRPR